MQIQIINCKTFPKGRAAKAEMMKSNLPSKELGKIWKLADTDKDGMLDMEEFALAMHLIKVIFFMDFFKFKYGLNLFYLA